MVAKLVPKRLEDYQNGANMYASLTPQILAVLSQLSWRHKALLFLGIVHHWRFSVRTVLYAISLFAKPVRSIADSPSVSTLVSVDFGKKNFSEVQAHRRLNDKAHLHGHPQVITRTYVLLYAFY